MEKFRCWYLSERYGWIIFEQDFDSEESAVKYCESKTDFKGSTIVEKI